MMKWAALFLCAGAAVAAYNTAPPWEKSSSHFTGQSLFREHCTVCHDVDKDQKSTRKIGPSLRHLLSDPARPLSKGRRSRAYVTVRIQYGGPLMPAFMKRMNDGEIAALLAYLESK